MTYVEINVIAPPKRVIALIAVAKKKKMMICNCAAEENSDIVNKPAEEASSRSGICPRCGKPWTEPETQSTQVFVTAPPASKGAT